MSISEAKKQIKYLRQAIRRADRRYYQLNDPEISDKEYDQLLVELKELEDKYPELITSNSPTQRVSGKALKIFPTVKHKVKMLSLDNTYSIDELKSWEDKIKRKIKRPAKFDYMVEPKIDGVSCSLIYEKGRLKLATTRGDGEVGEVVTDNVKTIHSLPHKLTADYPQAIEVRAEVYMEIEDFKVVNKNRVLNQEAKFANPRNATSGSLKLLDSKLVSQRKLKCLVHSLAWVKGATFKTQEDFLAKLGQWGLPVEDRRGYCRNLTAVIDYCLKQEAGRNQFPYEVDGLVVKVNSFSLQDELGQTLKSPRWAVAYKFPAHQVTTKVEKIEFGVGRTGIITPVAILTPVKCGGVVISRATLHNFDEVKRLDIRRGDTVLLERAGEVIPKIIKVISSKRTGSEKKVSIPSRCPVCRGEVAKDKFSPLDSKKGSELKGVYWYCLNPDCPAQLKRALRHFASRGAMDIEGLGKSLTDELVNRKIVKSLVDIYSLNHKDLMKLPLFKIKKTRKLILAIEQSRNRPLWRFLYGLGIRHVGEKAADTLAERYQDIDKLFSLSSQDLEKIPEIGPIMAGSIVDFFSSPSTKKMISGFKKAGLSLSSQKQSTAQSKLKGISFVFTGELESFGRNQAKELVKASGGKVSSSLSRKTQFLVAGKNPGSKYSQAKKMGLKIISEAEFLALIKK